MLSYPLRLAFQRVRVICKIRNYFLFAVLRDSKCIRAPPVASELFDTSCAIWVSQTITSFLEIKYQNKENNRQWGESTGVSNEIALPLTMTKQCYAAIGHIGTAPSVNAVIDFHDFAVTSNLKYYSINSDSGSLFAYIVVGY